MFWCIAVDFGKLIHGPQNMNWKAIWSPDYFGLNPCKTNQF